MKNWYQWDSLSDFNTWQDSLIAELGLPLISYNQATGEPEPQAAETVTYTIPFEVETKTIAVVENQYAEGLTPTNLRPYSPPPPAL
jgi:hypothetical protein